MNRLITPFGTVHIKINGKDADYAIEELVKIQHYANNPDGDKSFFFNVDGRYLYLGGRQTQCVFSFVA